MDFFVWQGVGGIHSGAMDDEHNAGRRKKTRFHGMLCLGIGISRWCKKGAGAQAAKAAIPVL
jgi:hypothetical protein